MIVSITGVVGRKSLLYFPFVVQQIEARLKAFYTVEMYVSRLTYGPE